MGDNNKEISVLDAFLYVIQRWRALIIWMIVGAIIFGLYGWYKSGGVVTQTDITKIEWESVLSPSLKKEVEEIVGFKKAYDSLEQEEKGNGHVSSSENSWQELCAKMTLRNSINSNVKSFTDVQGMYYKYLTSDAETLAAQAVTTEIPRSISLKYIIFGAFVGLIITAAVFVIRYVSGKTIKTARDLETYGFQLLGVFECESGFSKKHKLGLDKIIRKARMKMVRGTDVEDALKFTATNIQLAAEKAGFSKICLVTNEETGCEVADRIASIIAGNLKVETIGNMLEKSAALVELASMDGAVLVEQADVSKDKDICSKLMICSKYNLPVIGAIMLE